MMVDYPPAKVCASCSEIARRVPVRDDWPGEEKWVYVCPKGHEELAKETVS